MKRAIIAAAVLTLVFAISALAAENGQQPNEPAATFEQRQARILKMFDDRISAIQEAKTCVQAAKSDDDLRACRKKHMTDMREKHGDMQQHSGMMGGPQGGMGSPRGQ
jgi:hypothetical protein